MIRPHPSPFPRHIRYLIGDLPAARMTDGQLLERFLADRDEAAVEVLVRRYGPLVLGVCRRVLRNAHAAKDAFQATFLVLVRKAPSLDRAKPLGSWLYTVAYRLALRARANEARRQACEAEAARRRPETDALPAAPSDLAVALEEELQRLPDRHRVPLVLCYLEGKTNQQAAQALGCPSGSMSWRLAQARDLLLERLRLRGLVCPAGLAAVFAAEAAPAAVSLPLLHDTSRAALWFAAEEGAAAAASAQAVTLAKGVLKAMLLSKLKIAAGLLLSVCLLAAGTTVLVRAAAHTDPPAPEARGDKRPSESRSAAAQAADAPLPLGAVSRLGTTQLRHGDGILFATYTPDGKALLTAGRDRTIRLWDLATHQEVRRFDRGEPAEEEEPDTAPATEADMDRRMLGTLGMNFQVALSRDGKVVAANRAGTVLLWEAATGRKLREIKTGQRGVAQLAFAADGKTLLALDPERTVTVWEVATGRRVKHIAGKPAGKETNSQMGAVSPGLKYLSWQHVELPAQSVSIKILDLATGEELPAIKAPLGGAFGMVFSADDSKLAWSGFLGGAVVWDVSARKELRQFGTGLNDPGTALAFSPDGNVLGLSRSNGTVELWDTRSGKQIRCIGEAPAEKASGLMVLVAGFSSLARSALAFSPDGSRVAVSLGSPVIRQFDTATGEEVGGQAAVPRTSVCLMDLSPDGKSLRTYGHGDAVRSWDLATGEETRRLALPASAVAVALSPDGRLASAAGKTVTLRDAAGKEVRKVQAGTVAVQAVALSPDGATLATRDVFNPQVRLWDTATGKPRTTLGQAAGAAKGGGIVLAETAGVIPPDVVFSPDGRFLAGAGPGRQLCLWDVAAGAPVWEVEPATGQTIVRFAFSANGRSLAAMNGDGTITLYETATGGQRARLGQPDSKAGGTALTVSVAGMSFSLTDRRDAPVCLAFAPDGRHLAAARDTPEIHLWDLVALREAGRLRGHQGGVCSLLFTPDGRRLISGSTDTTALTWDVSATARRGAARGTPLSGPELEALWADLTGPDAAGAFAAIRKLSAAPDQAAALIRERVRPVSPPDPQQLARLVADLESDRFDVRRKAESALEGLGEQAVPGLRQVLTADASLDLRQRVTRLLGKLSGQTPARGLVRDLRAVEALELAGGPDCRRVLEALVAGTAEARLTREAKAAAERLARRATVTP
jgi:RNA polymerase sigma factor (sigma-70 family)